MQISLIAAMSKNGVIGNQNQLPWHIPEELKYFKEKTLNKPIIMGRKTFESIGKLLPNRKNIILTQEKSFFVDKAIVVHSIEEAIEAAEEALAALACGEEVMVIGGAKVYQQFLPLASKLYLTVLDQEYLGDAYFPTVNWQEWKLLSEEQKEAYSIKVFERKDHTNGNILKKEG